MSKKKAPEKKVSKDEAPEETEPQESIEEELVVEVPEEVVNDVDEEPEEEEEPKRKTTKKTRAKLTVLQAAVLETIRERPQRPRAIQTIIRSAGGVDIPRNEIIRSLNELRDKGLVDKVTAKAWQAK
ncbi:MAG: hypothetical protein ACFE8O_10605 [Candidatus Hermodarchaeota archaeon]